MLSCVWHLAVPWTVGKGPLCQQNFPGKNTRVGSHSLLQGIFPTQGSNQGLLHCRQILYHLSYQKGWQFHLDKLYFLLCSCMSMASLSMKPAFLCVCTNALDNGLCLVHNLQYKLHSEVFFWVPSPDAQPCSKKRQDCVSSQPEALCFLYNLSQVESFPQTKGQKLMWRAGSLEKTLMLGVAGKRRRGQQRMRQLNSITSLMAINLSKFWKIGEDRGA